MNQKSKIQVLLVFSIVSFCFSNTNAQCFWQKISAGKKHNLGVKSDGTLWAWGINNIGQLGDGTTTNRNVPVQIGIESNWTEVSAGELHSMALKSDGTLWTWGDNSKGQLGLGVLVTNMPIPAKVGVETHWTKIDAGYKHCLAISAVSTTKKLWSWGDNTYGQLGLGLPDAFLASPAQIGTSTSWASISAGGRHSMAMEFVSNGTKIWTFGDNLSGQLGTWNNISSDVPVALVVTQTNWSTISAGGFFSIARNSDGSLWTWGNGGAGELGNGQTSNTNYAAPVGLSNDWSTGFSAGDSHVLVKKTDGSIWSWGKNVDGELGNGTILSSSTPAQVGTDLNWTGSLAAGFAHSVGTRLDATMNTWGFGGNGELGNGFNLTVLNPTLISCPSSLGEEEKLTQFSISVYPNPSTDGIFKLESSSKILDIKVIDLLGQSVGFQLIGNESLYLKGARGTYFLLITNHNRDLQRVKVVTN